MKADFKDDYYYITSDSDSLFGEDSSIIRVKKEEFESFIYENYTKELEEKAQNYDELMVEDERLREKNERIEKELEPLREKADEAKKKQKEFLEKLDEIIKHTKKDIRRIAKKGIYYRDKIYTFDGYEKYIGETVSFEVQEPYLILTLEDKVFHATTQDI